MKLQREMEIDSLEQMCDLMCGGIEEDYDEFDMHEIYDEEEDWLRWRIQLGNT